MRKPERLDKFYDELCRIHKEYLPDWRFGQFIFNLISETGDPFFYEEDKMIEVIKKYVSKVTGKEVK